jgi:hypothetical protein
MLPRGYKLPATPAMDVVVKLIVPAEPLTTLAPPPPFTGAQLR